jgi:proline iminopeptidase
LILRTSDGVDLFLEMQGSGIPCIYLHGGPGYWSKSFQHFAGERLEGNLQMVYLDQRGCGRSSLAENSDYSLERLLLDIEEIRIHLGIDEWYVLGHSFGGILAVNYARRFPERVKGLILTNATLDMPDSFSHQITRGREILGLDQIETPKADVPELIHTFFTTAQQLIERDLFFKLQYQSLADKEKVDALDSELSARPDFQQAVFSSDEYLQDFRKVTSAISKPVLVLSGKYDHAIGPQHQVGFKFPNISFMELESGHHPYVDCPVVFTEAILDFTSKDR